MFEGRPGRPAESRALELIRHIRHPNLVSTFLSCERGSLTCVDEKQGPKSVHRKKAERRAGCNKRAYGENRAQRPKQIRDTSGARACGQADHRGEPEQETDLLGRKPAGFEETRPERRGYAERGVDRGIEDNETRQFAGLEKHSGRPVSPP